MATDRARIWGHRVQISRRYQMRQHHNTKTILLNTFIQNMQEQTTGFIKIFIDSLPVDLSLPRNLRPLSTYFRFNVLRSRSQKLSRLMLNIVQFLKETNLKYLLQLRYSQHIVSHTKIDYLYCLYVYIMWCNMYILSSDICIF